MLSCVSFKHVVNFLIEALTNIICPVVSSIKVVSDIIFRYLMFIFYLELTLFCLVVSMPKLSTLLSIDTDDNLWKPFLPNIFTAFLCIAWEEWNQQPFNLKLIANYFWIAFCKPFSKSVIKTLGMKFELMFIKMCFKWEISPQ